MALEPVAYRFAVEEHEAMGTAGLLGVEVSDRTAGYGREVERPSADQMTALPIPGPRVRRPRQLEGRRRLAIVALGAGALALASCGGAPGHTSTGSRAASNGGAAPPAPRQPEGLPPGAAVIPSGPIVAVGSWSGVEPSTISVSSAGGSSVTGITWSVWDDRHAVGTGLWIPRHCGPACSSSPGHVATVTLSGVADGRYTRLVEHRDGPPGATTSYTLPNEALSASNGP